MADKDEMAEVEVEQVDDIATPEQALFEEKNKAEKYLTNWQRTQADLDNYLKRAEQEKCEIIEFANRTLILNLLPIMDDFNRAFASLPAELDDSSWTEGIKLIHNKFTVILEAQGLVEIKAKGEYFDPYLHEAVGQQSGDESIIMEVIRKGYMLKDKLLRPSMVIVGKGKENKTQQ